MQSCLFSQAATHISCTSPQLAKVAIKTYLLQRQKVSIGAEATEALRKEKLFSLGLKDMIPAWSSWGQELLLGDHRKTSRKKPSQKQICHQH